MNLFKRANEFFIRLIASIKLSLDDAYEILIVLSEPNASPVTTETFPCSKINNESSEAF